MTTNRKDSMTIKEKITHEHMTWTDDQAHLFAFLAVYLFPPRDEDAAGMTISRHIDMPMQDAAEVAETVREAENYQGQDIDLLVTDDLLTATGIRITL